MFLFEALRVLFALALAVALPGWLLCRALFPQRGALRPAEIVYVSLAGGVLILMLIGSVLGFLPHGSKGHFQSLATHGMPSVELGLLAAMAALAGIALWRGAFPRVAAMVGFRAQPREARLPQPGPARSTRP